MYAVALSSKPDSRPFTHARSALQVLASFCLNAYSTNKSLHIIQNLQLGVIHLSYLLISSYLSKSFPHHVKDREVSDPGLPSKVSDSPTQSETNSGWNPDLDSWEPHWKIHHLARFLLINVDWEQKRARCESFHKTEAKELIIPNHHYFCSAGKPIPCSQRFDPVEKPNRYYNQENQGRSERE